MGALHSKTYYSATYYSGFSNMNDPASENSQSANGVTWRLRRFEDSSVEVFEGPIVLELADSQGWTVASFSILSVTINELLRPYLLLFVELQLDGTVSLDSQICAPTSASSTETDVLQLVSQAVAPEMLEDEPEAAQMLFKFRGNPPKNKRGLEVEFSRYF
jgi:hypothetical protein